MGSETKEIREAIIWADAHRNEVRIKVNQYGKLKTFYNGGYRIGILVVMKDGSQSEYVFYNSKCPDQFAGECYAVLKAIEVAKEMCLEKITIRNDRIDDWEATTKEGYIGSKYLWVAKKLAEDSKIEVTFERCKSERNRADKLSRLEGASQGRQN